MLTSPCVGADLRVRPDRWAHTQVRPYERPAFKYTLFPMRGTRSSDYCTDAESSTKMAGNVAGAHAGVRLRKRLP